MAKDRIIIPQEPKDAARVIAAEFQALRDEFAALKRASGRASIVTTDTAAKPGEFLNIEAPTAGLTVVLPQSVPALRNARVTMSFRNANPVRIVCVLGTVNATSFVTSNQVGTFEAVCDGLGGWAVQLGLTEAGPSGGALDAQYVLGAAHASLPNGSVATDSAEVNVTVTPAGTTTWALIDGSVVVERLENIPDQRVLGNDSGVSNNPEPITVHQELDWLLGGGASTEEWVFDGINDYVLHGDVNALEVTATTPFTIVAWVKTTASTMPIFTKQQTAVPNRGWSMFLVGGKLYGGLVNINSPFTGVQAVFDTSVNTGAFRMCAVTYDGSTNVSGLNARVDTTVQTRASSIQDNLASGDITISDAGLCIGARDGAEFGGPVTIKHVSFWNKVLSAAELDEVYASGTPPDLQATSMAANLLFWVKLDDNDATGTDGIIDYEASNDGTAQGGLAPTLVSGSVGSIPSRGAAIWETIVPSTAGLPLCTNGANTQSTYQGLTNAGVAAGAAIDMAKTAALTGDVTKASGSSVTAIAAGVIVDADVNASAAIDQTKLGATTGFSVKASGSASTTSAEPIVTYSASSNMSAERVTTSSTSVTVSTSVANQIEFQRAALTGDVTASANSNTTAIAAGVIVDADVNASANIAPTKLDLTALVAAIDSTSIGSTGATLVREALTGEVTAGTNSNSTTITRSTAFTWTGSHTFAGTGTAFNVNVDNASSIDTASTFALVSSGSTTMNFGGDSSVSVTGSLDVLATTDITLDADDRVFVTGAGILQVGDGVIEGYLVMQSSTTSAPNVASSEGMFWVEDPGSEVTRPKFTDDSDVDHTVVMTGTQTITNATGNLGTIDITGLPCGGTVIIGSSATGAHQIEGFSSANAYNGFFFFVVSNTVQTTQYLNQQAAATAADRLQLPGGTGLDGSADSAALSFHHAMFIYATNRWRGIVGGTGL